MALPAGVQTKTYTLGRSFDAAGSDATTKVVLTPVFGATATGIVWTATGDTFENFPIDPDPQHPDGLLTESFTLPVVDQSGWIDGTGSSITNWYYRADITVTKGGAKNKRTKILTPRASDSATMDLDLQPDGTAGAPVTLPPSYVTLINGHPGPSVTLDKSDVGLNNANNTSDANKPISTATQAALDLKANASAVSNVNNTSDANKPISGPQAAGLVMVVVHGNNPNVARPAGATLVAWCGDAEPVNATGYDFRIPAS